MMRESSTELDPSLTAADFHLGHPNTCISCSTTNMPRDCCKGRRGGVRTFVPALSAFKYVSRCCVPRTAQIELMSGLVAFVVTCYFGTASCALFFLSLFKTKSERTSTRNSQHLFHQRSMGSSWWFLF